MDTLDSVGPLHTAMPSGDNGHDALHPNLVNRLGREFCVEVADVTGLMSEIGINTDDDWEAQIKAMEEYGVGLEKQHSTLLAQQEQEEAEHQKTILQLEQKKVEGKRQQHVLMDKLDSVRVKLQLNNSKASRKNFLAKKEELNIEKTRAEEEKNRLSKELEDSEKRLVLLEEEQAEEKQSWEQELEELRKEMERLQKDSKDAEVLALQEEITAVEKHREVTMARIDAWLKEVGQYLNVLRMDPSPQQRHLRQEWEKHESLVRNSRGQLQVTFQEVLQQLRKGNEVDSRINVPTLPQTPMVDLIISQMRPQAMPRPPFLPYQMGPLPPNMAPNMANMGFMPRQRPPFPQQPYPFQPYPYPHPSQRYPHPNQPHPHPNQQPHHPNQPQQPHHPNQPQQPHHPNQPQQPHHPNQPQQPHHPNQPQLHPNQPHPNQPQPHPSPNQAHSYQQQQLLQLQQQQQQHLQFRPQMRVTPPPKLSSSPVQNIRPATPSPTLPSTQPHTPPLHPAPTATSSSSTVPPASAGKLDKLLEKLGVKFPQYTRAQLMSALQQIKSSRGTMAGLSMDEVVEQVGLKLADKPAPGPISRPTASATTAVRHSPGPIQRPPHTTQTLHNKPAYAPSPPPSPQQASTTSRKLCLVCQNHVEAEAQHPLSCSHIVHRDCISVWLQTSKSQACPFCPCK